MFILKIVIIKINLNTRAENYINKNIQTHFRIDIGFSNSQKHWVLKCHREYSCKSLSSRKIRAVKCQELCPNTSALCKSSTTTQKFIFQYNALFTTRKRQHLSKQKLDKNKYQRDSSDGSVNDLSIICQIIDLTMITQVGK